MSRRRVSAAVSSVPQRLARHVAQIGQLALALEVKPAALWMVASGPRLRKGGSAYRAHCSSHRQRRGPEEDAAQAIYTVMFLVEIGAGLATPFRRCPLYPQ